MRKVIVVLGTRPEAIKLLPVYIELRKNRRLHTMLVSTGQHKEMLWAIFDFFKVKPDRDMKIMTANQTLELLTSQVLQQCSTLFREEKPDLVVVQGDTTTAMAATLSSFYQRIPVAHVEAGLRSYDIYSPFPEEANRRMISLIASLHFAPTALSRRAVKDENVPGKVFMVGNTVIDSLLFALKKVKGKRAEFQRLYFAMIHPFERMVLITGHRRENFGKGFASICEAIKALAVRFPDTSWVYPVHLNPNVRGVVFDQLGNLPNVFLIDPVPYDHMVYLMSKCYLILTDSGGIQEEAPSLKKPVIVMRNTTERPEGIAAGCCVLAGSSKSRIVSIAKRLLTDSVQYKRMTKAKSPYGKGDSSVRISNAIKKYLE